MLKNPVQTNNFLSRCILIYDIYELLTINFKHFGPLLKKLPIRSLCYFLKCKNLHGVSTNSARAQPSKQNNRHMVSMYINDFT